MRWRIGRKMNSIVGRGSETVVALLQPFEANKREPAVRLLKLCCMLRAPRGEVTLPRAVLGMNLGRKRRRDQEYEGKKCTRIIEAHGVEYRAICLRSEDRKLYWIRGLENTITAEVLILCVVCCARLCASRSKRLPQYGCSPRSL